MSKKKHGGINWSILLVLAWGVLIYFSLFKNDFVLLDDVTGITTNAGLKNWTASLTSFHLQTMLHATVIRLGGATPLAFHTLSLALHLICTWWVYLLFKELFTHKIGLLTAWLFVSHPINTEAVAWASGDTYLLKAAIILPFWWAYLRYFPSWGINKKKNEQSYKQLMVWWIWYGVMLMLIRDFWVWVAPLLLPVLDWIKGNKLLNKQRLIFWIGLILITGYSFLLINGGAYTQRMIQASENYLPMNQQSLTPIWQSWPYSISTMWKLYFWPKNLMLYYDANPLSEIDIALMYFISLSYLSVVVWLMLKGYRKFAGLMVAPVITLAAALNPWGLTWYMAERYLYLGTAFWGAGISLLAVSLERKVKLKNLALVLILLISLLFSYRTIARTKDWRNTETLETATLTTSPLSIRSHVNLGHYYLLQKNTDDAVQEFINAIKIYPKYSQAIRELGRVWLINGITPKDAQQLPLLTDENGGYVLVKAKQSLEFKQPDLALYYYLQLLKYDGKYDIGVRGIIQTYNQVGQLNWSNLWKAQLKD